MYFIIIYVFYTKLKYFRQSPAVLHLEDCVEYDYSSINETNWKNVYETFPLVSDFSMFCNLYS